MKKLLSFCLVLSSLALIGCTGNQNQKTSDVSFQELDFGEEIIGEEKEKFINLINNEFGRLMSYSSSTNLYLNTRGVTTESKIKGETKFYDNNHIHAESTTETKSNGQGEAVKSPTHSVYDRFDDVAGIVVEYNTMDDTVLSYGVTKVDPFLRRDEIIGSYFRQAVSDYQDDKFPLYKDGEGYAFAITNIDEVTTSTQTEDGPKDYYVKTRTQEVFSVDKVGKFTSYYSYRDVMSNGLNNKGVWEDEVTLKTKYTVSTSFNYNERDVTPSGETIREKIRDNFKNGYFENVSLTSTPSYLSFNGYTEELKPDYLYITSTATITRPASMSKDEDITLEISVDLEYHEDLHSEKKTKTFTLGPKLGEGTALEVEGTMITIPGGRDIVEITINLEVQLINGQPSVKSVVIK